MEAFLVSTGVVALSEIGDKTQLLALLLAAKFRRPIPIILRILTAALANHTLAGAIGAWLAAQLGPQVMRWAIGLCFLAMAAWVLIPDKADKHDIQAHSRLGVYGTTVIAFFLAEMGDKTQIATAALAARFDAPVAVVAGTTLGMLLADVPAVFLGDGVARRVLIATAKVLLDREMDHPVVGEIREAILANSPSSTIRIADLHVWRVGRGSYSCAVAVVTDDRSLTPDDVRKWLAVHEEIVHCTIEVNPRDPGSRDRGNDKSANGGSFDSRTTV